MLHEITACVVVVVVHRVVILVVVVVVVFVVVAHVFLFMFYNVPCLLCTIKKRAEYISGSSTIHGLFHSIVGKNLGIKYKKNLIMSN